MSETRVVLLGVGAIGRELLRQVATNARPPALRLRICGLIDTSGYVYEQRGLSWRRVMELRAHKANGRRLADADDGVHATTVEAIRTLRAERGARSVLVDATAADTAPWIEDVLARGWDVVLANKLPLSGSQLDADRLHGLATARNRQVLHEATVGAGLPVIDTLRKLLESGDRVLQIEGCPSGTLGYLFCELGGGRSFADALRSAIEAGYTEADPRLDLSGLDVARKALILGRLLGFRGELHDIEVESLVPARLSALELTAFVARVDELNAEWRVRVEAAKARGAVLRYRARISRKSISVGLAEVRAEAPLGWLSGTDNQFAFTTARYRENPLVITGPGAGPAVTAAGVYGDLLCIASGRGAPRASPPSACARSLRARPASTAPSPVGDGGLA
jgi:aspartokinase/homoserine dehydrogenase 1